MQYEVIIAGAGISGLAAASWLQCKNIPILVLEARSYCGGRVVTDRSSYPPIDLGASWIHGSKNNPVSLIAENAHLHLLPDEHNLKLIDRRKQPPQNIDKGNWDKRFYALLKQTFGSGSQTDTCISLKCAAQRIVQQNPEIPTTLLSSFIRRLAMIAGGDPDDVSSCFAVQPGSFTGTDMWFPDGYDGIIQTLTGGLEVLTNFPVQTIDYNNKEVIIETECRPFRARSAIITFPLGVLQKGKTLFNPPLPEDKRASIDRLCMGTVNKTILCFSEGLRIHVDHLMPIDKEDNFFDSASIMRASPHDNRVILWSAGRKAKELEKLDKSARIDFAANFLSSLTGRSIPPPIHFGTTLWHKDPYACGSYSFVPANQSTYCYDILSEPVKTLFFAGEATYKDDPGTVHGAYLSGIREARRVYEYYINK